MAYNFLIVDDSSVIRKVLRKTFSLTDIPVGEYLEAENGKVALEKLKNSWVDIIFLDINMPVMNGLEFLEILNLANRLKETPVVVVSTEGSNERKEELERYGIRAYLRKPVTPELLVETVKDILGEEKHG